MNVLPLQEDLTHFSNMRPGINYPVEIATSKEWQKVTLKNGVSLLTMLSVQGIWTLPPDKRFLMCTQLFEKHSLCLWYTSIISPRDIVMHSLKWQVPTIVLALVGVFCSIGTTFAWFVWQRIDHISEMLLHSLIRDLPQAKNVVSNFCSCQKVGVGLV